MNLVLKAFSFFVVMNTYHIKYIISPSFMWIIQWHSVPSQCFVALFSNFNIPGMEMKHLLRNNYSQHKGHFLSQSQNTCYKTQIHIEEAFSRTSKPSWREECGNCCITCSIGPCWSSLFYGRPTQTWHWCIINEVGNGLTRFLSH
jgi:hypothetical protein